jgi:hypothetical protein
MFPAYMLLKEGWIKSRLARLASPNPRISILGVAIPHKYRHGTIINGTLPFYDILRVKTHVRFFINIFDSNSTYPVSTIVVAIRKNEITASLASSPSF